MTNNSATTDPGQSKKDRAANTRWLLLAAAVVALALLPLSRYGMAGAQEDGSINSKSINALEAQNLIRFNLVPAADAIANCFPNAKIKGSLLTGEEGTDTLTLNAKGLRPNTTFAVFLTELPVAPFGAVQYVADLVTNGGGKGSVEVNAIVAEAFSSQVVDGQRIRKEPKQSKKTQPKVSAASQATPRRRPAPQRCRLQ